MTHKNISIVYQFLIRILFVNVPKFRARRKKLFVVDDDHTVIYIMGRWFKI